MSNQWFRMYSEFATDPKVQSMSEVMQRRLVMLFCSRCSEYGSNEEELAFFLRITPEELSETKALFIRKNFIDDKWNIIHWDERQFVSDTSNERVKKYREKRYSQGLTANGYTKHTVTVTQRDGNCCVYCGSTKNLCIDHILPVCQDGTDDIENLACACKQCNSGKAGKTPEQSGYSFINMECEKRWLLWMRNRVTVTVTAPEQSRSRAEADTEKKERNPLTPTLPSLEDVAEDLNLNDFATACSVLAACLGLSTLTVPDQEAIGLWCSKYDMRKQALPLIDEALKKYIAKNKSPPKSVTYFSKMLIEKCDEIAAVAVNLGRKMRKV